MYPTPLDELTCPRQLDFMRDSSRDWLHDAALGLLRPLRQTESARPFEYDQSSVRRSGVAFGAQPCPARRHARPSSPCFRQSE